MATRPVTHPSADALRAFALGKLDDSTASVLMSHLDACPDCCKAVAAFSGDDFLGRMRQAHGRSITPAPARSLAESAHALKPPATPAQVPNLPPELAANQQYEILRELGRGGMGVVYLAKNKLMDRLEVLKVVNKSLLERPGAVERFLREIRSAAKLSHVNVVAAYSAVQSGDLLAFAMEYVEGDDLAKLVKTQGPLPVAHACYYVQQAALGLQHAYENGMIHRDIKPQNLILARKAKKHLVKVLDFGLAKATREKAEQTELTGEGAMLGTPDYVAPEQTLDAAHADIRADIYSLGCTLYYLLTGAPPFKGRSLYEVLQAHHSMEARPLNLVRPEVPEELAAVVRKMMAKEPAKRYQTPAEVAQALSVFIKPGAKGAAPKSSPELSMGPDAKPARPIALSAETAQQKATVPAPPPPVAWDTLTEESVTSLPPHKSGAMRNRRSSAVQSSKKKWLIGGGLGVGMLLLGLLGMWASGVFEVKVKTKDGTIELRNLPAEAEVLVDGAKVTVTWGKDGKKAEITVKPGSHKVEVKKDDVSVDSTELTLKEGDREIFTVRLLPEPRVVKADPPTPATSPTPPNRPAVAAPPPTTPRRDYDDLAKGRWIAVLPSVEEFNRLRIEKAYRGTEPNYVGGVLECNGTSRLFFSSIKAKDVIVRAWMKRSGQKHRGNVGIAFRNANDEFVGAGFNGGGYFFIGTARNRSWKDFTSIQLTEPYDDYFEFAFAVVGDRLIAYANGRKILEARDDAPIDRPAVVEVESFRDCKGQFRNIEVQVLDKPPAAEEKGFK
jgi:serine/threonine protein kinase